MLQFWKSLEPFFSLLAGRYAPQVRWEICSSFVVFYGRLITFESTQPHIKLGNSNMFIHLGLHKSADAVIVLLLLCQFPAISAFRPRRNVVFDYCWNSTVQYLNTTDYDDKRQYFPWDRTHSYRLNLSQPLLSLFGCESLCNDGYELWPADDTLSRAVMWVLPACVLLVHFHIAPLGFGNKIAVITHSLGDPFDTLWSMMTRQEVNRRLLRRANELGTDKHVATIWSAYDELGWGNPAPWFDNALQNRQNQNPERRNIPFTQTELYYIQLASHRLACNRSESQFTTWIAIFGFVGALCAAFIRTYTQKLNNQTAHTIAVVSLFFILIPIVKISGNIGSFTSTSIAMDIIQELQRNLGKLGNLNHDHPLFPPLRFNHDAFRWDYSRDPAQADDELQPLNPAGPTQEYTNLKKWPKMAPWAGMNNSWRPCKHMLLADHSSTCDRSGALLFFMSLLFVMCAYSPALVLSFRTPTVGFGCRSMAWTMILTMWVLSVAIDQILNFCFGFAEKLWIRTLVKDFIIMFLFLGTIVAAQIGLFNNCWCRSTVLELHKKAHLEIGPQSRKDWDAGWLRWVLVPLVFLAAIGGLIFLVGQDGENARTLLSRSEHERQTDLILLTETRSKVEGTQGPNEHLGADQHIQEGSSSPTQE